MLTYLQHDTDLNQWSVINHSLIILDFKDIILPHLRYTYCIYTHNDDEEEENTRITYTKSGRFGCLPGIVVGRKSAIEAGKLGDKRGLRSGLSCRCCQAYAYDQYCDWDAGGNCIRQESGHGLAGVVVLERERERIGETRFVWGREWERDRKWAVGWLVGW